MSWWQDLVGALTGRGTEREPAIVLPAAPTSADIVAAVDGIGPRIAGRVPDIIVARVDRIAQTVKETVPRLGDLGAGSRDAHSVMATATSYLPEALEAYLRLPRSFADRRPVDGNKTSLMVLVDQLDLLAVTMEKIRDAVYRADAEALVAHGRFLAEKFGHSADGGSLNVGGTP
ncbi:hypothetical protein [Kineosporia sp. A_224]|uniref:hypothetical protein n=1 Tax=Kineosporia sp. A_224 TaxID=1962180 RepID=UPI000B4B0544|nr:hypothetical protein [Kineosporia sp. A_224]